MLATMGSAFAEGSWLSGASTVAIGEKATFSGGGFAPSAALTIQITDAQGGAYTQSVVADASGAVVYEITPSVSGSYNLTVINGNGTPLATTSFGAF